MRQGLICYMKVEFKTPRNRGIEPRFSFFCSTIFLEVRYSSVLQNDNSTCTSCVCTFMLNLRLYIKGTVLL